MAVLEVTVDLQAIEAGHLVDLSQQSIELFVIQPGPGQIVLLGRALQLAALLVEVAALLQIGEPLLHVERLATGQQIEIAHRIAAAAGEQHQGQGIAVALEGHGTALAPIQRLHPDPGPPARRCSHVKDKHGTSRSAKG
ncbi:hypothetical protein D3C72_1968380 [compost metagenome]